MLPSTGVSPKPYQFIAENTTGLVNLADSYTRITSKPPTGSTAISLRQIIECTCSPSLPNIISHHALFLHLTSMSLRSLALHATESTMWGKEVLCLSSQPTLQQHHLTLLSEPTRMPQRNPAQSHHQHLLDYYLRCRLETRFNHQRLRINMQPH